MEDIAYSYVTLVLPAYHVSFKFERLSARTVKLEEALAFSPSTKAPQEPNEFNSLYACH